MDNDLDKQSFINLMAILNTALDNKIPNGLVNRLLAWRKDYSKQLRVDEVEKYADYLSDQPTQAAFELAWQQYCYTRSRAIDNE